MKNKKLYIRKTVKVPKKELQMWDDYLVSKDLDYSKLGFGKYENLKKITVDFDDGSSSEIRINANAPVHRDIYSECVLFSPSGCQVDCTECCDHLSGYWELKDKDDLTGEETIYQINVIPDEDEETCDNCGERNLLAEIEGMSKLGFTLWDTSEGAIFFREYEYEDENAKRMLMFRDWDAVSRYCKERDAL